MLKNILTSIHLFSILNRSDDDATTCNFDNFSTMFGLYDVFNFYTFVLINKGLSIFHLSKK